MRISRPCWCGRRCSAPCSRKGCRPDGRRTSQIAQERAERRMNDLSASMQARLNPVAFWFLRHGETDWNAQGLSQGNVDIPLNKVGLEQARRAARTLEGQRGEDRIAT